MDYDSLLELVEKRRSVHKFKPDPIPDEYIDKIIEVAHWAPSGANSQPWEFVVIKKEELRNEIIEIHKKATAVMAEIELTREQELRFNLHHLAPPSFINAPVFIIPFGDPRAKDCFPLGARLERGDAIFASSLASAFLYMMLGATALGLGAQWVSAVAHHYPQSIIKDLLGVPKELEMYDMMAVGYPDMEPPPRLVRPREEIVQYDGYDKTKFRTDRQVRDFIIRLRKD
ncbi:nitroreductase family protein [Thermodesulfobacteriota bacterium]